MVAKFYCQDYIFMLMLEYCDLNTQCFTSFDEDCIGACHLKNYCFVITYLLEDEQELSLGMLDTSPTYL
jgi:hypothetical protein